MKLKYRGNSNLIDGVSLLKADLNRSSIGKKVALFSGAFLLASGAWASMEDLSDYSEFGEDYEDYIDYPDQESQEGFPEFSWDTIPRWIIFRSDKNISDDAVERVAEHFDVTVMEKANQQGFDYIEDGAADLAARLKAENPDITNLHYWNTRIRWGGYYANIEFDENDDWVDWSRTESDNMDRTFYEHDVEEMRDWWHESILDVVEENDDIDGVFLDTIEKFYFGSVLDENGDPANTYIQTIYDLNNAIEDQIIVYNGLQNGAPDANRNYLQLTDGVYEEATMDPEDDQTMADAFAIAIQLYREAASKGKLVLWRGSESHQTYFTGEEEPEGYDDEDIELREDFYERNVYFTLAMYLMLAEEYAYFAYSGGDYAGTGENGWHIWDTTYMDIFQNPLGEPLADPVKDGYYYSRSFKYLDVNVDVETGDYNFDWKDTSEVVNLAEGQTATQSSTLYNAEASRAVDGETDGSWGNGSVTHTESQEDAWWEVDLGVNYSVRAIKIHNRTDCCSDRLSNFTVSLINSNGTTTYSETFTDYPDSTVIMAVEDEVGSTVRVELNEEGVLSLAEVEVFGNPNPIVNIVKSNAQDYAIDGNWGGDDGQDVYLYSYDPDNINQQWEEIDRGDGYYSYQKLGTNYSLDGGDDGTEDQNVYLMTTDADDYNQHWLKVDMDNGYYQLQKRNALDYAIDGNAGAENTQSIELWRSTSESGNLQWLFEY